MGRNSMNRFDVFPSETKQVSHIWEVVEELVAKAYEQGTATISMSQIREQLKHGEQNRVHDVEEVRKTLIDLGYRVTGRKRSIRHTGLRQPY